MDIFEFDSYKTYLTERVKAMPNKGHGQFTRMAEYIGISPVVVTQVLKGHRDFTEEQALGVTQFLGMQKPEVEFFLRLLAHSRAGTPALKDFHSNAIKALRAQANEVRNKVQVTRDLDDTTKSIFYSDWTYSAVRLLTSIPEFKNIDAIAEHLQINRQRVSEIMEFLLSVGLVRQKEDGSYGLGIARTHLDAQSKFINNHRRNWRLQGLEGVNRTTPDELFFSVPCTLSHEDFDEIKKEILAVISTISKRVSASKPQKMACLNIDWFKI